MKKLTFFTLLWLAVFTTRAQSDPSSFISSPIDISTAGWNKVLQMQNGNTLLFHFEWKKNAIVKVFDKDHKEIATVKPEFRLMDLRQIDNAVFSGLMDVNGEATLFISQQVDNVKSLVRLRFSGIDGKLVEEERIVKSASLSKETITRVLRGLDDSGYNIACFTYKEPDTAAIIKLIQYNSSHIVENELTYEIPTYGYDYASLQSAGEDRSGNILLVSSLSKIIQYPELMDQTLALAYLPKGAKKFITNKIMLPERVGLGSSAFTVNQFAGSINMVVNKVWVTKYGKDYVRQEHEAIMILPESITGMKEKNLDHNIADKEFSRVTNDVNAHYYGNINSVYTSDAGKTTVIFEDHNKINKDDKVKNYRIRCAADLCIAEYDDEGNEIWSTILPKANYYSPVNYPPVVFNTFSESELYHTVFLHNKRSHYILYNEIEQNFNKKLGDSLIATYDYDNADIVCYSINRKNEVSKQRILSDNDKGIHRQLYSGSVNYDIENNSIAGLMKQNKAGQTTLHLLWYKFID